VDSALRNNDTLQKPAPSDSVTDLVETDVPGTTSTGSCAEAASRPFRMLSISTVCAMKLINGRSPSEIPGETYVVDPADPHPPASVSSEKSTTSVYRELKSGVTAASAVSFVDGAASRSADSLTTSVSNVAGSREAAVVAKAGSAGLPTFTPQGEHEV
jgi:hypothetical protein